jgi:dipeptidyl aminopeptidase/acylaminoacyl peptidase
MAPAGAIGVFIDGDFRMTPLSRHALALTLGVLCAGTSVAAEVADTLAKPAAMTVDGAPPVTQALADATAPYLQARSATFLDWNVKDRSMLVRTRFGETDQLHTVAAPGAARTQVSFDREPVLFGTLAPARGDALVVQKDIGGGEFYQLFRLDQGKLTLLTDGKSRNWFGSWSRDGRLVGYMSTRRNGADGDLYVIDPRDPSSDRLVAQVTGGGWNFADFSPDGGKALVVNRQSIAHADVYEVNLANGALVQLNRNTQHVSYEAPHYGADGRVWLLSDAGSDFKRLGVLDAQGGFKSVSPEPKWDVSDYAMAPDGSFVAYAVNEAGVAKLRVLDVASGQVRKVDGLPGGVIPWSFGHTLSIAPWGDIALSMSSAKVPGDVFSIDSKTLKVTRWTMSEAGGLETEANVEPELVTIKSFDGEPVTGFLYRPDAKRFPGKRPLLLDIHGGPEGQSRPDFLGAQNYYLNELGIALFFPNVRGSDGFGKRFVGLDNGPFKREDSVKDIGAMLASLAKDQALDASRFGVTGVSYGGYMCYASAVHYSAQLKGASCYVGISNFVTFLENTQSYRRDLRRPEYGDERDPKQRAQLQKISPLNHVDKIRVPLLIATGANDPRVPASEADQIIEAVRGQGGSAWHLLAGNEGHGFHKKDNADYYFRTAVMFWQQQLLGEGTKDAGK